MFPAVLVAATTLILSACGPGSARPDRDRGIAARSPEAAALATIQLDPGAPPNIRRALPPVPLRSAARRSKTLSSSISSDASIATPALQIDSTVNQYPDLWSRIRGKLSLRRLSGSRIEREIAWFQRNNDYLNRLVERARRYLPYIVHQLETRKLPIELALLPAVESAYQPFAYSPARASGLWQFIPSTARLYGLTIDWWYDGRRDVIDSTDAALTYLSKLSNDFDQDWLLVGAAYNWGEGNVQRSIRRSRRSKRGTDFWSLRLPRETRAYVPRWLALVEIVARPERYGISLGHIPDEQNIRIVELDSQIDLALAAELADVSLDDIYLLNPGFNRWATHPKGPHRLVLPSSAATQFEARVAAVPAEKRITWRRHVVAGGDTLDQIANRYRTTVVALKQVNNLRSNTIRINHSLMVPVASRSFEAYKLSADVRTALERVVPPSGVERTHVVRRGESLWTISRRYQVRVKKLAAWNAIAPRSVLRIGRRLRIWPGNDAVASTKSVAVSTASNPDYTVRCGDNLSTIAKRHRVSAKQLAGWNKIRLNATLYPGQTLKLARAPSSTPVAATGKTNVGAKVTQSSPRHIRYTVRRGDSLWVISRRFNVSVAALRRWNSLPDGRHLQPGQTLNLYLAPSDET